MKAQKTASTPSKNPLVGNNPGGIFPLVDNNKSKNDDEGISSTEKMILENPVYAKLMPERVKKIKRKTKKCKNQIRELAPAYMKKSAFSKTEKKRLENTCGSVPDGKKRFLALKWIFKASVLSSASDWSDFHVPRSDWLRKPSSEYQLENQPESYSMPK